MLNEISISSVAQEKTMNMSMVPLLNYIIRAVEKTQPIVVGKSLKTFSSTTVYYSHNTQNNYTAIISKDDRNCSLTFLEENTELHLLFIRSKTEM